MIGTLRRQLTLEQATRAADGFGGVAVTWAALATVWAAIRETGGGETLEGGRLSASRRVTVTIRYREGVATGQRFSGGGQIYEILALRDRDARRRYLDCDCLEREIA